MTQRDRKALAGYIRELADLMELRDWTVDLELDPSDQGTEANVVITYGRKLAQVFVAAEFRGHSAERQRHTIVHELVHCHLESASNMVRNDLEEHLGRSADKIFWTAFKRQIEYGIDGLADALAPHLPLIEWP